ncbi:hypothetical protein [Anderseniella sp. Alg231-50]|uniref:hypothetical protein n=1 Tax=Anderseniella sp. Alg231-50 TaxID=1922226 RepID=UPI00307B8A4E
MSQIETIMLVALGFVGALLVGLLVVRGLWTYAVSLGKRRVERRAPSAIAELRADRDRLKAEYAMQGRRLQLRLDDLKTRMAEQMAEASRNRNRIEHLADEISRRDDELTKRDEDADNLRLQITALERELTDRTELLQQAKDLLQAKEEISIELQSKLKVAEAKVSDQWFIIETLKSDNPPASADLTGMASSKFENAQERLRQRIEEMNSLTRQIDEQRQDLSVQQDELAILREQINRSREADARVAAAGKTKSKQTNEKSATPNQDMLLKSGQVNASEQLEQKIIETERETETLTEELSRLDEMWNKNNTDMDADAAENPATSEKPEDKKAEDEKAEATKKSTKARKANPKSDPADTAKDKAAKKPADDAKSDADGPQEKSAEQQQQSASAKASKAKSGAETEIAEPVAMAEVKLPGSSMEVTAVAQDNSQPVGKTLAAGANAGNNNIISLAQRIRALHSDVPGNS